MFAAQYLQHSFDLLFVSKKHVITFNILFILRNNFLSVLPSEKKPFGSIPQVMILICQVFCETCDLRWRQTMSEWTEKTFFSRMLIPIKAMPGCKNVIIELDHGENRGVKEIYVFLYSWRCQLEDSGREEKQKLTRVEHKLSLSMLCVCHKF